MNKTFEIVVSTTDPASLNIYNFLKQKQLKNTKFYFTELDGIYADINSDADFLIVLSTHSSQTQKPCLTLHSVGNFRNAELGGISNTLMPTDGILIRSLFLTLKKYSPIDVDLEATHHGPVTNKPTVFVEIGSTEKEWNDPSLGKIWANVLEEAINNFDYKVEIPTAIYVGGLHYSKASSLLDEFAIGHVCAKYNLPITEKDLLEMIVKTNPKPQYILVERKGLGEYKQETIALIEDFCAKYNLTKKTIN
ncbi:MAG: D-aminoacyl-tRNA deacylase [Candidatus Woesearchaeota archaeon]